MNFKNLFLALGAVGLLTGVANADTRTGNFRKTPYNAAGFSDAQYGGANIATMSFTTTAKLIFTGPGVFQGIDCSSLPATATHVSHYATVHDSATATGQAAIPPSADLKAFVHAATITVGGVTTNVVRLVYYPPIPWVLNTGLVVDLGAGDIAMCSILYTKFD